MRSTLLPSLFAYLIAATCSAQTFTVRHTMPGTARDGAISFTIAGKIYVGGGTGCTDLHQYDPATDSWATKAALPNATAYRSFATAFAIGDKGYVCLGQDGNAVKNDLWEYDATADHWTRKADYPVSRAAAVAFAVNGQGYVCGGTDNQYIYPDFYRYDPPTDTWASMGVLPNSATCFGTAFSMGGYGYITGGDHGGTESAELYRYDPIAGTWSQRADFIGSVRQTAVGFTLNGKAYVGLGQSQYTTVFNDFFSYDPVTDQWAPAGTFPPGVRCWATAANTDNRAFVGTGWDFGANFFNDWWEFAPAVGIANIADAVIGVKLYPDPATDKLSIRFAATGTSVVHVIDQAGRTIMNTTAMNGSLELDVRSLISGAYELVIEATPQTILHERFIRQ